MSTVSHDAEALVTATEKHRILALQRKEALSAINDKLNPLIEPLVKIMQDEHIEALEIEEGVFIKLKTNCKYRGPLKPTQISDALLQLAYQTPAERISTAVETHVDKTLRKPAKKTGGARKRQRAKKTHSGNDSSGRNKNGNNSSKNKKQRVS